MPSNPPKGIYPTEHQWKEPRSCIATGEYRKPRKGEYYLSDVMRCEYLGAVSKVCGCIAPDDLSTEYWIARPIAPVTSETLRKLRRGIPTL